MKIATKPLQFARGFDENDLYDNLAWLADHQATEVFQTC
jgi:hypothetical protein